MNKKHCYGCNKTLDVTQFSKCRSKKDGLQLKCKECNKKDNDRYRKVVNPEYWNFTDGYFSDKSKWHYIRRYQKADKTIKVYEIKVGDSYYIGCTKAQLHVRMNQHICSWRNSKLGKEWAESRVCKPLNNAIKDWNEEDMINLFKNAKVIEECHGGKAKMYKREEYWIKKYIKEGYNLLNVIKYTYKNGRPKKKQTI